MTTYLITGANRGFGLALVHELLSYPTSTISKIFATSRSESSELDALAKQHPGRVIPLKMDVTDEASVKKAAAEVEAVLEGKGLDVLINNAAVCEWVGGEGVKSMASILPSMTTNVQGVHLVTRSFLPLLQRSNTKKVVNISTALGSITIFPTIQNLPCPAYKISKAALNALTLLWALEYEKDGFVFVALSPGWMKTSLGGGSTADLTPSQGAKASLEIIQNMGKDKNGKFCAIKMDDAEKEKEKWVWEYNGQDLPW